MESGKVPRGSYIKGDSSDFVVIEFLKRKEHLLEYNPKGKANGAVLRRNAADEITTAFNARFPLLGKSFDQIKEHFEKRRDSIKRSLAMERSYISGTGGGVDGKAQAEINKLANPSYSDSLLIDYLKKSNFLGVGDITLETGHIKGVGGRSRPIDLEIEHSDEGVPNEELPIRSLVKRGNSKGKLSMAGVVKAEKLAHVEWLRAAHPAMAARAASRGYGKKSGGWARVEEEDEEPVKKQKKMEPSNNSVQLDTVVSSMAALQGQMSNSMLKGQFAIEGMEQLRAMVKYGGAITAENLSDILMSYDRKVAAQYTRGGGEDDPILLG